jgi:hypothetical protein
MGQEESAAAQPVLASLGAEFTADTRVTDVLQSLLTDSSFVLRSTLQTNP